MRKQSTRTMHPNSLANLEKGKFKKGQSGNPLGHPRKADCLLDCIKDELTKLSINGKETNEQLIAGVLVAKAARGDIRAVELMMSYLHARPTAGVELSSKNDKPLFVAVLSKLRGYGNTE